MKPNIFKISRRKFLTFLGSIIAAIGIYGIWRISTEEKLMPEVIKLPEPVKKGKVSVEQAIANRRSRRDYSDKPVLLKDISQLCWASQGITEKYTEFRAVPSAGALYPLETFLVIGNSDIDAGIYHYSPSNHTLELMKRGDYRNQLCEASLGQESVKNGAICFVITAIFGRTTQKYGKRGEDRYVPIEVGCVAENIYLQAEALGLATVAIGAFYDDRIQELIPNPPLLVMPVGHV